MITDKFITFVSFCVDIDRGKINPENSIRRDFELYRTGMYENLDTNVPLVMYTSENNVNIPKNRNENNLIIQYFDKKNIEEEFPNFKEYSEIYPKTHKDEIATELFYYAPLVVLKMKKIIDVIDENPFNSDMFFWMDCHFTRGIIENSFLLDNNSFVSMYETVKSKIGDKFLLFNYTNRPFGFFWGGTSESIKKIYKEYFNIFFESLPKTILTEELIFKKIHEINPDLFHFVDITGMGMNYKEAFSKYITKYDSL